MSAVRAVLVVAPGGVDDPLRPSGGNVYDQRVCQALSASGWSVQLRQVAGDWPRADAASRQGLAEALASAPPGAVVLVDGLVALLSPEVMVPAARRQPVVVLVHMPVGADVGFGPASERAGDVLRAARAVVATSDWTRRRLLAAHGLDPGRVHVATPGVDRAVPTVGDPGGARLLSVGAVTPVKGHDLLVAALSEVAHLSWRWRCVGPLDRDAEYVAGLRHQIRHSGLGDRVELTGPRSGPGLDAAYASADVLVVPSRAESYGMVVTEALARALPVLASDVGGVPEALGATSARDRPGVLVPAGDVAALAGSLRAWLTDGGHRRRLRLAARQRRDDLTDWADTGDRLGQVLQGAAA